jgi:membrane protein required for colicin V production
MNHVDIILVIPLAIGAIRGFARGFVMEAAALIGLIAGVFLAALIADILGKIAAELFDWNVMTFKIIIFVVIFVIVVLLINMAAKFIEKLFKLTGLNIINRIAGIGAGIIKWAFVLSVVLIFFNYLNRSEILMSEKTQNESFLYNRISGFVPAVLPPKDFIVVKDTFKRIINTNNETD